MWDASISEINWLRNIWCVSSLVETLEVAQGSISRSENSICKWYDVDGYLSLVIQVKEK